MILGEGAPETVTVVFEYDKEVEFHEKFVAMQALGAEVAKNAKDVPKRTPAARLAAQISAMDHLDPTVAEKDSNGVQNKREPVETPPLELSGDELSMIMSGLTTYIGDTPEDIRNALSSGDLYRCAIRAVQADLAQKMLLAITEYTPSPSESSFKDVVGFAAPRR